MKNRYILIPLLVLLLLANSCVESIRESVTYRINEPIFMHVDEFRNSVKISETKSIGAVGKIALDNNYLYVSEPYKGIHIIDNSNPIEPIPIAFIELIGNTEIEIEDSTLYADSFIDLVWFNIANPAKPILEGRKNSMFPISFPQAKNSFNYLLTEKYSDKDELVIGWNIREITKEIYKTKKFANNLPMESRETAFSSVGNGLNIGKTDIKSKFTIDSKQLYTIDKSNLNIYKIDNRVPIRVDSLYVGWDINSISIQDHAMFLGTPIGAVLYSISDTNSPILQSTVDQLLGYNSVAICDGVVYATINSNSSFGNRHNQLILVDLKDLKKPKILISYPLTKPNGVGISDNKLAVCDDGLKLFSVADPLTILDNQIYHYPNIRGQNIYFQNGILIVVATDGIYQFSYSDTNRVELISKIPIQIK